MTKIEPMVVETKDSMLGMAVAVALLTAVITSIGWVSVLQRERQNHQHQLDMKISENLKIKEVVIKYANGTSSRVEMIQDIP